MGWVESEVIGLFGPGLADLFVRGEAREGLETTGEVVSGDEVDQVGSELVVAVIVIAVGGRLDGGRPGSREVVPGALVGLLRPV